MNNHYYQNPNVEFSNLKGAENDSKSEEKFSQTWAPRIITVILFLCTFFPLVLFTDIRGKSNIRSSDVSTNTLEFSDGKSSLIEAQITIKNPIYGSLSSLSYLPWSHIAEPYKEQNIELSSFKIDKKSLDLLSGNYEFTWSINKQEYTGKKVSFQIDDIGQHDCKLTVSPTDTSDNAASESYTYHFVIMMKYVRREIRSLTTADREKYFKALKKIYSMKDVAGKALYGDRFRSAEVLLLKHLNGAGTSDCDHWHDGPAILTHHVAFTLEVEQALQSIDSSLSMPYWEYGMDKYLYPSSFTQSPIFDADWFGTASPTTADHSLNDSSYWSTVEFPSGEDYVDWDISTKGTLNPFVNAYGVMRSPWNNNPAKGLCRSNATYGYVVGSSLPSCDVFKQCFQSTTLAETNYYLNGVTHGPVHIMIGGAWDEDSIFKRVKMDYLLKGPMKVLLFKVLWRMGYTRCPSVCADDAVSCNCAIPDKYINEIGPIGIAAASNLTMFLSAYVDFTNETEVLNMLRGVEDPGIVGDMLTSSAAYDPTFWPLHGSAERLMAYKRSLLSQEVAVVSDFDDTWGYPAATLRDVYLNGICDWSNVAGPDDLTLPTCTMGAHNCPGHNENDHIEFSNFLNRNETYTNREMWEFMHPWNDDLPYVYDTYDYNYCSENGYDFLDYSTSTPSFQSTFEPTAGIPPKVSI